MPTLEALDALKKNINELGDEPRILAERGETPADVGPPETPSDPDLERLLDEDSVADDGVDEMEALLGAYSEDLEGLESSTDSPVEDTSEIDDLLGDLGIEEAMEDFPEETPGGESEEVGDIETDDLADFADDGDFSLDDIDLGSSDVTEESSDDFSLDDLEPLPAEGLDDILGDSDAEETEPETSDELDEDVESAVDLESEDDFSLDDLDFGEIADGGVPEEESAGIGELEDTALGDEAPTDDFSLEDLDFGEAETAFEDSEEETTAEDAEDISELESDDFTLDNLDLGDTEETSDIDSFEEEAVDIGELEETGELEVPEDIGDEDFEPPEDIETMELSLDEDSFASDDLEELGDIEEAGEDSEEIPDVESALDDLGDLDSLEEGAQDELSFDDELNFDEELGADALADITDIDDDTQQFSMEDFGEQYNFKEGEDGYADNLGIDLEKLEQSLDEATEEEAKPFSISEEDLEALLETLSTLPRNLQMALEELLADERRNPYDLQPLIDALITGETPKTLADKFKSITKRSIKLPRSYQKRSGKALEERRAALVYQLAKEGWPVARTILLIIAAAWGITTALFMWVYRPLKAESLYEQGLVAVSVDEVDEAVSLFHDAWDGWPLFAASDKEGDRIADAPIVVKGWKNNGRWLDYARSFRRRKHWSSACIFYEGYLSVKPGEKDARLEYAEFLSRILGRYADALNVLEGAPKYGGRNPDRDYTLAAGDVYLDWAEDDPSKFEEARFRYAKVLETSRNDERAILSMMRYNLRLGNEEEIEILLPIFKSEVPGRTHEPELAAEVFADLGAYHLARGNSEESRRFINLALAANPEAPEPHFADAQYWKILGNEVKELEADKRTLIRLEGRESLSKNDLEMRILTLGSMGRIYSARALRESGDFSRAAEYRNIATSSYSKALRLYEDALTRNQLGASPVYGKLYLELGDILYEGITGSDDLVYSLSPKSELLHSGSERYEELAQAVRYYDEAEAVFGGGIGGMGLPAKTLYRRAYARYSLNQEGALVDFHRVVRNRPGDYEARLALAAALLRGGDFEASRSQYARAIELLDDELRKTGGLLNPVDKQGHGELLIRYVVAWNNLGVGRARSAARGGGEDDYASALSAFTMSSEYSDEVFTDMPLLAARGMTPLRDLDERRIMSSSETDERNLLEEKSTYPYRNRLRLLGLESAEAGEEEFLSYTDIPSDLLDR